jgi:hypothetical protein
MMKLLAVGVVVMRRFVISDYREGLPGDFPRQPFHSQNPSLEKIRAKQAA